MCVSRLSMPADAGREDIALDFNSAFHTANERSAIGTHRYDARHGFAMFGYDNPFGAQIVEQGKALFFESGRINLVHAPSLLFLKLID